MGKENHTNPIQTKNYSVIKQLPETEVIRTLTQKELRQNLQKNENEAHKMYFWLLLINQSVNWLQVN